MCKRRLYAVLSSLNQLSCIVCSIRLYSEKKTDFTVWSYSRTPHKFGSPTEFIRYRNFEFFRFLWYHGLQYYAFWDAGQGSFAQPLLLSAQGVRHYPSTNLRATFKNMMSIRLPQALLFLEHTSVSRLEDPSQWLDLLVRVTNTVFDTDLKEVLRTSAVLKVLFSNVWRRETFQWFLDVLSIVLRLLPQSPEAEAAEPEILFLDDLHRINMTFWVLLDEVIVPKLRPLGDGAEDAGGFLRCRLLVGLCRAGRRARGPTSSSSRGVHHPRILRRSVRRHRQ
uniref:Uncharacterized protein n=1 Tax=Tetraselmis sp. GSL018 TaxID=582737 RepID=A0A061SK98_9CHLO